MNKLIFVIFPLFFCVFLLFCSCRTSEQIQVESIPLTDPDAGGTTELIALCNDENEAKEIADLYQIELLSYGQGVAVYSTEKDPFEVISYGQKNHYPLLSINHTKELYETETTKEHLLDN